MLKISALLHSIRSKIIFISDEYHFYAIALVLLFISFRHNYFIVFFIGYTFYIFKKVSKKTFVFLVAVALLRLFLLFYERPLEEINQEVIINGIKKINNYFEYQVTLKGKNYLFTSSNTYKIGDLVKIIGKIEGFSSPKRENAFDITHYYLGNNIYGKIRISNISFIKETNNYFFKRIVNDYISNFEPRIIEYFEAFFFGSNIANSNLDVLGLGYIIGVSGMALYGCEKVAKKCLFYLDIKKTNQDILILIGYFLFSLINNFGFLTYKILIQKGLSFISSNQKLQFTNLDIVSISFGIVFLSRPYYVYNIGAILSFIVSFGIAVFGSRDQLLKKVIKNALLVFFLLLPITAGFNNEIVIFNFLLAPVIQIINCFLIIPNLLISSIIIPYQDLFIKMTELLDNLYLFFRTTFSFKLLIPTLSFEMIIFYYLLFIISSLVKFKIIRKLSFLISLIIMYIALGLFYGKDNIIYFLDVGNGESTVIRRNKSTMVIDAFTGTYQFLVSNNIQIIDYLVITHFDLDHSADAQLIINNLKVQKVVVSYYERNIDLSAEVILRLKSDDFFIFSNTKINVLGPLKEYNSRNNNSLVLKFAFKDSFLFPGDIEKQAENDLINKYGSFLDSDIIKVPHHGSNTSSSLSFINNVSPKYGVIFSAKNNQYGFPHLEIINRYQDYGIKVYQTALSGSIYYDINEQRWDTYL